MNIEQLAKDIQNFIKESYEYHKEFKEKEKYLLDNYHKGILGDEGLSQELDKVRNEINAKKREQAEKLKAKIQQVHEKELKYIEDTTESITVDELAELQLISDLGVTDEEMNGYIQKYKRKPLALKKLQEVAKDRNIVGADFPRDRKQYLNTILGRWDNQVNRWQYMTFSEMTTKLAMYMDGAVNGIDEDLRAYEQL